MTEDKAEDPAAVREAELTMNSIPDEEYENRRRRKPFRRPALKWPEDMVLREQTPLEKWLRSTYGMDVRPKLFTMSGEWLDIQAGAGWRCAPEYDVYSGEYASVTVRGGSDMGFLKEIKRYRCIHGRSGPECIYVPVRLIMEYIEKNGGIKK